MIINAQKVEHYEIAGYGSLVALANQLGHGEVAKLLQETLQEEKAADEKLNKSRSAPPIPPPAARPNPPRPRVARQPAPPPERAAIDPLPARLDV